MLPKQHFLKSGDFQVSNALLMINFARKVFENDGFEVL